MADKRTFSRRKFLSATGAAVATGLAGCSSLPFTGPSEFEQQLTDLEDAVEPYRTDVQAAIDDGYIPFGPMVPNMGWHFINQELSNKVVEEGFSITEPPILLYDSEGNLGGVEFGAPAQQVSSSPDLFADEDADATEEWGLHEGASHAFSNGDGEVQPPTEIPPEEQMNNANWTEWRPLDTSVEAGDELEATWGQDADGNEGAAEAVEETRVVDFTSHHPDMVELHVWVVEDNPQGIFAPLNPEFANP